MFFLPVPNSDPDNEEKKKLTVQRRLLRQKSNVFELPDDKFESYFRLNKEAFQHVLETISPYLKSGISPADATKTSSSTKKVPKSVSDKKRFFESAMEDQHKPTQKKEKVFSFLSKDEVEKLKQEEERKIATLCRDKKKSRLFDDGNRKIDNRDDDDDDVDGHHDSHDDDDNDDENDYSEDDDDDDGDDNDNEDTDDDNEDAVDMARQTRNANDNIDVLREAFSDDDVEDISSKTINQGKNSKRTKTTSTTTTNKKISKLKAPTQNVRESQLKDESKEKKKLDSITNKTTEKVILKPKVAATTTKLAKNGKETSKKTLQKVPLATQMPSETTAKASTSTPTPTPELTKKPSLLPKPKVKVIIPPALLQKQRQQQQKQQQKLKQQDKEYDDDTEVLADEYNDDEQHEPEVALAASSRIPVRSAAAEKRALLAGSTDHTPSSPETSPPSTSDLQKSKALINSEKRASWRAARMRSLEKGAVEAQTVIQNMSKIADDLLTETLPTEAKKIVFPKIAIKSSDGPVIIREREKILDEKIVRRTEEVPCPITGRPQLRTVEYIEKIIETEVETSREKIISLELQDPEKSDSPHASIDLMAQQHEVVEKSTQADVNKGVANENDNQQQGQVLENKKQTKSKEKLHLKPVTSKRLVETVEKFHIQHKYEDANDVYNTQNRKKEHQHHVENVEDAKQTEYSDEDDEEVDEEGEEEEETDSASIVTVQQNTDTLFLRDDEEFPSMELDSLGSGGIFGPSSLDSVGSSTKVTIKPSTLTMHQTLAKEVVLPATAKLTTHPPATQSQTLPEMNDDNDDEFDVDDEIDCKYKKPETPKAIPICKKTRTTKSKHIVEVVNPLITGEGQVQHIAFSRSRQSEYPCFDHDDEDTDDFEIMPSSQQLLRSETFVLPAAKAREELSLNAKMKNVLEELLENERVKYNLQKSLEEQANIDKSSQPAYGDTDDEEEHGAKDEIDFAVTQITEDDNGNHHVLNALIRDSNRNTLQKLKSQLQHGNDNDDIGDINDDEEDDYEVPEEDEDESDDTEESESSDSDDDDDDDDDDETIHITFVDGAKVIENFNTNTPVKLQKSQTYNTMKEAADAMAETPDASETVLAQEQEKESHSPQEDNNQITLEKLLAEQQKYAEISKQLRKSVESLLVDDDDHMGTSTSNATRATTSNETQQKQKTKRVVAAKKISRPKTKKTRPDSAVSETGEEIFNRLLHAGGSRKQIFDQETDEILTTSTTTCTEDNGTIITTTTTTISNVTTSGIPRKTKHAKANKNNGSKNVDDRRDRDNDGEA